ncbi:MAG: hypothetical protein ABIR86_03375 [Sphingomicrobium sp.]
MKAIYANSLGCIGLLTGACAVQPQVATLAAAQPQCASIGFPTNDRIDGWSVDKFGGRYSNPAGELIVHRDGHRLLVDGWNLGTRELTANDVGSWTWRDGCGVRYDFTLPPDGPGAWLRISRPDGTTSEWHR